MLLCVARHHAAREQVQLALRDLDEAVTWLERDTCVGPVDVLVHLAAWRLKTISKALHDRVAETGRPLRRVRITVNAPELQETRNVSR